MAQPLCYDDLEIRMLECPSCGLHLIKRATENGIVYACSACHGRAATLAVLRKAGAEPAFTRELWLKARDARTLRDRPCPHCASRMKRVSLDVGGQSITLDVCRACTTVWFDASEFETMPRQAPKPPKRTLSPQAREQAALFKLKSQEAHRAYERDHIAAPDHDWQWLPGLFGLPVEMGAPRLSRLPWITWTMTAFCVITLLYQFRYGSSGLMPDNSLIDEWGFIPSQWSRHGGLTLITSFFLHGGILHLLSNTYFMLVFGDNVEDSLGRIKYIALVFLAHLAGTVCHGLFGASPHVPCVGASAGISGIIAFYAVTFPNVRLGFMFRYFLYIRWFRIRAVWALVLYTLLQILGAAAQVRGFGNVAYLAHLGGLVVGLVAAGIVWFLRRELKRSALTDNASFTYKRDGVVKSISGERRGRG